MDESPIEAAVARLRESDKQYHEDLHKEGFAAGRTWAMQKADAGELRRLDRLRERTQDWTGWFNGGNGAVFDLRAPVLLPAPGT